jgi:hypothetical protein
MIAGRSVNRHHLLPKLKGGKGEAPFDAHVICHSKVHSIWSEAELARIYRECEGVAERVWSTYRENEDIVKFIKWVSKKDPEFRSSNRMVNGHKKRRGR